MPPIRLIAGLGNPGPDYARTRHNAGFWFVQRIADYYGIALKPESRFQGLTGKGVIEGQEIRLLLPTTFMNKSGAAVVPMTRFYQLVPEQLLIAHDELDIPAGHIRLKQGGGHGGHNGLRDICPHLGNDFWRLRLGIDHPGHKSQVTSHVLGKPVAAEQAILDEMIEFALNQLPLLLSGQPDKAIQTLNSFKPAV